MRSRARAFAGACASMTGLLVLSAGCSSPAPSEATASLSTRSGDVLIEPGERGIRTDFLRSTTDLIAYFPVVIVGIVEAEQAVHLYEVFPVTPESRPTSVPPTWIPTPDPGATRAAEPPDSTFFTVRVDQVVAGSVSSGSTVRILQSGARAGGVTYVRADDPLRVVGSRYLLVLRQNEIRDHFGTAAAGRFVVTADERVQQPVSAWKDYGAVKALDGRKLSDVVPELRRLAADMASGKVTPEPWPSPRPTLVPATVTPARSATSIPPPPSHIPQPPVFPTRPPLPSATAAP